MNLRYYLATLFLVCGTVTAQERNVSNKAFDPQSPVAYPKKAWNIINETRSPLQLPVVEGYTVLKCDFHMHTVFSDGYVWPTTRVEEAFIEGLDVIALTEHLEFHHLGKPDVNAEENLNREFEIAKKTADQLGIILISGAEVTREVPAGHYNVIFLKDANLLEKFINYNDRRDTTNLAETLQGAKDQGAFVFWNHPDYHHPQKIAEWFPIHEELYQKGLIMGIEVANSNRYIPLVHQWATEKNLTMFSNSDAHNSLNFREGTYRPMTLVFAKERSKEAIKEAIFNQRTVAFSHNYLYGKKEYTEPLFQNSLRTRCLSSTDSQTIVEITNTSDLDFDIKFLENDVFTPVNTEMIIFGRETVAIILTNKDGKSHKNGSVDVKVDNIHILAAQPLNSNIKF